MSSYHVHRRAQSIESNREPVFHLLFSICANMPGKAIPTKHPFLRQSERLQLGATRVDSWQAVILSASSGSKSCFNSSCNFQHGREGADVCACTSQRGNKTTSTGSGNHLQLERARGLTFGKSPSSNNALAVSHCSWNLYT